MNMHINIYIYTYIYTYICTATFMRGPIRTRHDFDNKISYDCIYSFESMI